MGSERRKGILLGTSSGYLNILITNLLSVVAVPVTLGYFGTDRYGALALVMTFVNYLSVTNFGIPSACAILGAKSADRRQQLAIVFRSFLLLGMISTAVLLLFLGLSGISGWVALLGRIPPAITDEVRQAAFWTAVLFLANLFFAPFLAGFIAIRKVHVERFYNTISTNSYVLALAWVILFKGNLAEYALARGALVLLCSLAGALHFLFGYRETRQLLVQGLQPLLDATRDPEYAGRSILASGGRLFVVGLASLVVWQTDNLVISHFLGVGAVTPYQVTFKLITMTFILFTAINPAISPHYGRAWAEGDRSWINGTWNQIAQVSSVLGGLVWLGSLACAETVIDLWAGHAAYAGSLVVCALGGYGYLLSLVGAHAALLTSLNLVRNLPLISWLEAAANLALSLLLIRVLGMAGVALGTFLASLCTVFWLIPREIGKRTEGTIRLEWQPLAVQLCMHLLPAVAGVLLAERFIPGTVLRLLADFALILAYLAVSWHRFSPEMKTLLGGLLPRPLSGLLQRGGPR